MTALCFDWPRQQAFARLSGDTNPLHLDPVWARRTPLGQPVVHGIHGLAWALDAALSTQDIPAISAIGVRFLKPILVGDTVGLETEARSPTEIRLALRVDGVVVTQITLWPHKQLAPALAAAAVRASPSEAATPPAPTLEEMEHRAGAVGLPDVQAVAAAFPALARAWGVARVAGLIATSRLVGMECPGLHSLYAGLRLALRPDDGGRSRLAFAVTGVDHRFRTVEMEVAGPGIDGTVTALARLPPVAQPDMAAVRAVMPAAALADRPHQALIVGGSRGLGALTARLVAAGGGRPVITHAAGRAEAEALAAELGCAVLPYDIRQPAAAQLAGLEPLPTHLYYFATGHIFRRPAAGFSEAYFADFARFYVSGFAALLAAVQARGATSLKVFYPSTTALDQPLKELAEYAAAKAAGEQLCAQINRFTPGVEVLVRRLPRLLTDQTATPSTVAPDDALAVMLPIVLAMHGAG